MSAFRLNVAGWMCQVIGTLFLVLDSIRVGIRLPREGIPLGDPPAIDKWYYHWASTGGFFLLLLGFVLVGLSFWVSRPSRQISSGVMTEPHTGRAEQQERRDPARAVQATKMEGKDLYRIALDTRNLEITMFWQRCNYFLVLNSALALGFFNLKVSAYAVLLAGTGLITSILWFAVSLGSKFWQARWEYRLSEIEKHVAPGIEFFATDRATVKRDVEESLRSSGHSWPQRCLDRLVLEKPSVSFMMMLLSLVFIAAWATAIALFALVQRTGNAGV